MLVKTYGQDVVLCAVGLAESPNENGHYVAEFYPIDLLLRLRQTDQRLEGHPYLVLQSIDDGMPTVMVEALRPSQAQQSVLHRKCAYRLSPT